MKHKNIPKGSIWWNYIFNLAVLLYFIIMWRWNWHKNDNIACVLSCIISLFTIINLCIITHNIRLRKKNENLYSIINLRNACFSFIVLLFFAYIGLDMNDMTSLISSTFILLLACCHIILTVYLKIKKKRSCTQKR